jgi:S-adenosylmethionine synthetase
VTFGTAKIDEAKIQDIVENEFDLTPYGITKMLDLKRPIYQQTASYGHFGRTDVAFPWESLDKVDKIKNYL